MTDKEIKKALECCTNEGVANCDECPYNDCCASLENIMLNDTLNLINRQKAEINRLHNILLSFTNEVHTWSNKKGYDTTELSLIPILNEAESARETIKNEAVKEFAERMKAHWRLNAGVIPWYEIHGIIDNLVKEFTEGEQE